MEATSEEELVKRFTRIVSKPLAPCQGLNSLFFALEESKGKMKGQPHTADGRVTLLLRRKGEIWKVIHYHESRPPDRKDGK